MARYGTRSPASTDAAGRMSSPARPTRAPNTAPSSRPASASAFRTVSSEPAALSLYATTVSCAASASASAPGPAVSGSSTSDSVPSASTVPLRAARSCSAVMPGTVSTVTPGSRAVTPWAR